MGIAGGNISDGLVGGSEPVYSGATPTNIAVGAIPSGFDPTGMTALQLWEKAMVTYLLPAFTSFLITGQSTLVEIGSALSGLKPFTWGTSNSSNVQANTIEISNINTATVLYTGGANDGTQSVDVGSIVFGLVSYVFRIKAQNTLLANITRDLTFTPIYPYFFGKVASGGAAAGANRPVINQSLINSGTKVIGTSTGIVTVNFNSTVDDYIWFAIPASSTSKSTWYVSALNSGAIGGAISAGGNLFPNLSLLSVTTVLWAGISYKVYLSNYQTASTINMELRN